MASAYRLLRSLFVVGSVLLTMGAASTSASEECRLKSLEQLRAYSPGGYAIYERVKVKDPAFFDTWVQCDDAKFSLPTAVHESTHFLTSETDAFPLVGGGEIARPHDVSAFFPPLRIAKAFEPDDLVKIYLRRGKASSATDFLFLLDEFNAYTHDLDTAVDMKDLTITGQSVDHRDGLSAMMAFVTAYAETARAKEPKTWRGLRQPQVAGTITQLWRRAEGVMSRSCGIPDFGTLDRGYLRRVCAAGPHSAIAEVLGRAPICPTACLVPRPQEDQEEASAAEVPAPLSDRK